VTTIVEGTVSRLQVVVEAATPESILINQGAVVRSTTVETSGAELVVELPARSSVRETVDNVAMVFDGTAVLSVGDTTRSVADSASVSIVDMSGLTAKQTAALEAAFPTATLSSHAEARPPRSPRLSVSPFDVSPASPSGPAEAVCRPLPLTEAVGARTEIDHHIIFYVNITIEMFSIGLACRFVWVGKHIPGLCRCCSDRHSLWVNVGYLLWRQQVDRRAPGQLLAAGLVASIALSLALFAIRQAATTLEAKQFWNALISTSVTGR